MNWFLLAITSASFSAAAAILQKRTLKDIGALEFSLLLSIFNVIFSIPFLFIINFAALSYFNLFILFLKSILGCLAFLCVMLAIKNLEISKALPLLALTPGFVAIFAFLFIGDSLTAIEIVGLLLLLAGTYILEADHGQKVFDPFMVFVKSKNHHYVIFALLLFTATSVIDRLLLNRYNLPPNAFFVFQNIFFAFFFVLIFFFSKKNFSSMVKSNKQLLWSLIITISIITITYRYTEILAVKIAPVALVLAVKRISVFFAVVIGGKIFKEKNLFVKMLAAALIIAGVFLIIK